MPSRKNRYLPYEVDTSPCHFTDSQPGPSSCEIDKSKQQVLNSASGGAVLCKRDNYKDKGGNEEKTADDNDDGDNGMLAFGWGLVGRRGSST